jgi:hypothetical protein
MTTTEIPLLRESAAFAGRLVQACRAHGEPRYRFHRRVNWSYRYEPGFYAREAASFIADAGRYLAGRCPDEPRVDDVYAKRLEARHLVTALLKVVAHRLFGAIGGWADRGLRSNCVAVYRKAYVDDIELVFDPAQPSVVRAVYPFPINMGRQWRYLRFLRQQGHRFKLAGNPYALADVLLLLQRRDVHSLMRLESRAQIRHARDVAGLGVRVVQLSDEFDIGSLDFARTLARFRLQVVNSAHGVGKYFPVHAYQTFHVLTQRQREFYWATRPCSYPLRQLNDRSAPVPPHAPLPGHDVVFLSQSFGHGGGLIDQNEATLVQRLKCDLVSAAGLRLHYKPHPNNPNPVAPEGFTLLTDLAAVNGRPSTVFLSFFSTCQIDPAFKGRKLLVRGHLIHPEIAFDDGEEIVDADTLVRTLQGLATASPAREAL